VASSTAFLAKGKSIHISSILSFSGSNLVWGRGELEEEEDEERKDEDELNQIWVALLNSSLSDDHPLAINPLMKPVEDTNNTI